jgi:hypothetical protein
MHLVASSILTTFDRIVKAQPRPTAGDRNGQYRHGERTKAAIAERQKFSALLKMPRGMRPAQLSPDARALQATPAPGGYYPTTAGVGPTRSGTSAGDSVNDARAEAWKEMCEYTFNAWRT